MAYTALGTYNDADVSEQDRNKIQASKDAYAKAYTSGDTAGMAAAHSAAESVRAPYGYSGGDGSQYIQLNNDQPTKSTVRGPASQSDMINQMYAAQRENALAGLKAAYDQNVVDLDAAKAKIPGMYNEARNQSAAVSEQNRANFNELAAARGLNSGAGGQAALAQNIAQQNNMTKLNGQEAQANTDIETQRVKLSTAYNNAIQQAVSENDFQKAQALYNEGVRVDNALMQQSQQQAALDYQYWQSNSAFNQQKMQNAWLPAQYGDFSSLNNYYDPQVVTNMQTYFNKQTELDDAYKQAQINKLNFNGGSGGGRSGSGGGSSSGNGNSGDVQKGLFGPADNGPSTDSSANIAALQNALAKLDSGANVSMKAAQEIMRYYHNGLISSSTKDKYLQDYS